MDQETKRVFDGFIAQVNTTEVHEVTGPLSQREVDLLAEELLSIRAAKDYLNKRREELRKMAFDAMDATGGDGLLSARSETKMVRQHRGGQPKLDPAKIREYLPEWAEGIIERDWIDTGIDQEYLQDLLDGDYITQDDIRKCFTAAKPVPALTFEDIEYDEYINR